MSKQTRDKAYNDRVKWLLDLIKDISNPVGAEIGLWKADFAMKLLNASDTLTWYGVDPYRTFGRKARDQKTWDGIYQRVAGKMKPYSDRFTLVRETSVKGADMVPDGLDIVFIDGNHDYENVLEDITVWEKKLKPGGILSGHDYFVPKDNIRKAVNKYTKAHRRKLQTDNSFDERCGVFWWTIPKYKKTKKTTYKPKAKTAYKPKVRRKRP